MNEIYGLWWINMLYHWGEDNYLRRLCQGKGSLVVAMIWWLLAFQQRDDRIGLVFSKFYFSHGARKMTMWGICRNRKWAQPWLLTHLSSGIHAPAKMFLKWKWSGQGHGQNILLMLFSSCLEIQIMSHVHYWKGFWWCCLGKFARNLGVQRA